MIYSTFHDLHCSAMDCGTRLLPWRLMFSITRRTPPMMLPLSIRPMPSTHCGDEAGDGHAPAPPNCALQQVESNPPEHSGFLSVCQSVVCKDSSVHFPSSSSQQSTEQNHPTVEVTSESLLQSGWSTEVKRNHLFNPTYLEVISELSSCR